MRRPKVYCIYTPASVPYPFFTVQNNYASAGQGFQYKFKA